MAYLGNAPARSFISFERQVFTIVNSQTAYTLSHSVNNENDIRLVINNIVQEPGSGKAYTASGTTLTLSAALTNGTDEMYCVFLGRAVATNAPAAGSVNTAAIADLNVTTAKIAADAITEAKIADDAVESEHLNDNVISGQTELATAPADTDEFLVSDAGTLKRIDYSLIKGGGIENSQIWLLTSDTAMTGSSSYADITANISEGTSIPGYARIGDAMSVSSGVFTFPTTGIWTVEGIFNTVGAEGYAQYQIQVTTNNSAYNTAALSGEENDNQEYSMLNVKAQVDVTDTSNVKVKFRQSGTIGGNAIRGTASYMRTGFIFTRIGDT